MRYACLIILLIVTSCREQDHSDSVQQVQDSCRNEIAADSVQNSLLHYSGGDAFDSTYYAGFFAQVKRYDTVTPNGNFVRHFADSMDQVFIVWGTPSGEIIDTMLDEGGGWSGPCSNYVGETDKYLLINATGHGYMHVWLLPLHKTDSVSYFVGVIDFDISKNLILSSPGGLMLTNFATGKQVRFTPESLHAGMYGIYEIDSLSFRKDAVYLEWQGEDDKHHTLVQRL